MNVQAMRNEVLRLFDGKRKKHLSPEVQLNSGNTWEHELMKIREVWHHMKQGHVVITEGYFKNGKRADIVCLDCRNVYEVVVSEKIESIAIKREDYPEELGFEVIKAE